MDIKIKLYAVLVPQIFLILYLLFPVYVIADPADVLNIEVTGHGDERYTFNVTIQHNDTGWDHYADAWVIFTEEGKYLAARNLQHPHIDEQPVTRSLPYVHVPAEIKTVVIRAHCSQDKFGGAELTVNLDENSRRPD